MFDPKRLSVFLLLSILALSFIGCSKGPEMGQVTGTVTDKQGLPMAGVVVYFLPATIPEVRRSMGLTDERGAYTLVYQDDQSTPGAVVGSHVIIVEDFAAENSREQPMANRVPLKYYAATQTPLRYNVMPGEQKFDIKLE